MCRPIHLALPSILTLDSLLLMMTGQKVVCINDQFPLGIEKLYVALPKSGVTYVVRDVTLGVNWAGEPGEVAITLVGMLNPRSATPPFPERAFNAERFRPLEDERVSEKSEKRDVELV